MAAPTKWRWDASNGNATAEETAAAYHALTHPRSEDGKTSAFKSVVWDDIISKISAQRQYWGGTEWEESVATLYDSLMAADHNMTAKRFNSAVANFPFTDYLWPWETRLKRENLVPGDVCMGEYFINLTDAINYWIDLLPIDIQADIRASYTGGIKYDMLQSLRVKPNELEHLFVAELKAALTVASGISAATQHKLSASTNIWCGYINDVISALFFLFTPRTTVADALSCPLKHSADIKTALLASSVVAQAVTTAILTSSQLSTECEMVVKQSVYSGANIIFSHTKNALAFTTFGMPMFPRYMGHVLISSAQSVTPVSHPFAAGSNLFVLSSCRSEIRIALPLSATFNFQRSVFSEIVLPALIAAAYNLHTTQLIEPTFTVSSGVAIHASKETHFEGQCKFAMAAPILAIELDNTLVSELDDGLVENVEYRIIL